MGCMQPLKPLSHFIYSSLIHAKWSRFMIFENNFFLNYNMHFGRFLHFGDVQPSGDKTAAVARSGLLCGAWVYLCSK